jgi:glycosyltransferase involved in cell wall biosynthesis
MEWYRGEYLANRRADSFQAQRSKYPPIMLLYVGQLIERKNVTRLLEAFLRLRDRDIGMFIVGSGPQQEALQEMCRRAKVDTVYFEGFKQQAELPWYYAMSDVLVLPSVREVWGLVVNEALATGLYVLCSDRAAVAYDLIKEDWNGRLFAPGAVDRLTELIRETKDKIGEIRARREAISEASCREFSIERSARALAAAIHTVADRVPQTQRAISVPGGGRGVSMGDGAGRDAVEERGAGGTGASGARAGRTAGKIKATRVLIVTNILSPYRVPLLNVLADRNDLELAVILLAEREANREWKNGGGAAKFDSQVLPGLHWLVPAREVNVHLNWGLGGAIRRFKPDVLLTSGYNNPSYWMTLFQAKKLRKPFVLWFNSWLHSAEHNRGAVVAVKRFFVQHADAHVAFGGKARECLEVLGAYPGRIFTGLNTVDMDWYREEYRSAGEGHSFRAERSKYPPVMFLYAGQLIERKNIQGLLEAFARLRDREIGLFIVGSGPQREELEALCRTRPVENVFFEGFKQQVDMPRYYAMADVLILPSAREVWGLVVNEALATGLFVLCSNRAAAGFDLITDGWNGRLFDPHGADQLAELIRESKRDIAEIRARREAISESACREFGIERLAEAFAAAIRTVTVAERLGRRSSR